MACSGLSALIGHNPRYAARATTWRVSVCLKGGQHKAWLGRLRYGGGTAGEERDDAGGPRPVTRIPRDQ